MSAVYNEAYFIEKFEAIPLEQWTTDEYEKKGCYCALGHCGEYYTLEGDQVETNESFALKIFVSQKMHNAGFSGLGVPEINDGALAAIRLGDTPKERILTVLQATPEELYRMMCRI